MSRLPTPADLLTLSIRTSLQLAEAGTVFWLALQKAGLWWMPASARPAAVPLRAAPARSGRKRPKA